MARKRLLWQLYPSYVLVAVTSLVSVGWYAAYLLEKSYLAALDRPAAPGDAVWSMQEIGESLSPAGCRTACVLLCDASPPTRTNVNLSYAAVGRNRGRVGPATERSMASALRTCDAAAVTGAAEGQGSRRHACRSFATVANWARSASWVPAAAVKQATRRTQIRIGRCGPVDRGCAAALLCLVVSRQVSRPFEEIREVAERFARGDLAYKLAAGDSEEMTGLAGALNQMASQLQERLQTIVRQTSEQQAVLSSMVEGVLAIDAHQRVITLNKAAAALVGNTLANPLGRNLHEVVRNPDLRRFADRVLASNQVDRGRRRPARRSRPGAADPRYGAARSAPSRRHRRRDRDERRDAFPPLGDDPPRLRRQRIARTEDADHFDQGIRRDAARRRAWRTRTMPSDSCASWPRKLTA